MRNEKAFPFDATTPVGQVARTFPDAIGVFERLEIEYACNGGQPLLAAADDAGVLIEDVLKSLRAAAADAGVSAEPELRELVHSMLPDHHRDTRDRLGRLSDALFALTTRTPVTDRLQRLALRLERTIRQHMEREERDLFPAIARLCEMPTVPESSIVRRIYVEFVEHDTIHDLLIKLRELRLRALLEGGDDRIVALLLAVEQETLRHIHLENNLLLPKALELENHLRLTNVSAAV